MALDMLGTADFTQLLALQMQLSSSILSVILMSAKSAAPIVPPKVVSIHASLERDAERTALIEVPAGLAARVRAIVASLASEFDAGKLYKVNSAPANSYLATSPAVLLPAVSGDAASRCVTVTSSSAEVQTAVSFSPQLDVVVDNVCGDTDPNDSCTERFSCGTPPDNSDVAEARKSEQVDDDAGGFSYQRDTLYFTFGVWRCAVALHANCFERLTNETTSGDTLRPSVHNSNRCDEDASLRVVCPPHVGSQVPESLVAFSIGSQQQQIEETGDADVASDAQIKIVLEELACMNVAKAGAQIFPHTLPTYYMKIKDEGPRIFTVEPCHFHISGCMRGDDCRYSHLTCESAEAIWHEFERYPMDRTGVRPADISVRRARLEGLTAPEIHVRFPGSFPDQETNDIALQSNGSENVPNILFNPGQDVAQNVTLITKPPPSGKSSSLPRPSRKFSHTPTRRYNRPQTPPRV